MAKPDPSKLRARCPSCGLDLWARRGEEWTLKTPMVKLGPTGLEARCPGQGCRGLVRLPFLEVVEPPEPAPQRRRYVVRRKIDT